MHASSAVSAVRATGECVVPGAVEPDLWEEQISRYRFASLFSQDKRVLDIGCGTGYGTDLLAANARLTLGSDHAPDAISYASERYLDCHFVCASATALPFRANSFDLAVAFEVLQHIELWECLVEEAARVLTPDGVFLVSTPNKLYCSQIRQEASRNPRHAHELELEEFQALLLRRFPFVQVLAQNHHEAMLVSAIHNAPAHEAILPAAQQLSESHFLVAVCSQRPLSVPSFTQVSSAGNLLREHELHINSLKAELAAVRADYLSLLDAHHNLADQSRRQAENASSLLELAETSLIAFIDERKRLKRSFWIRTGRVLGVGPWSSRSARVKAFPGWLWNSLLSCLFYVLSPLFLIVTALVLAGEDLCFRFFGHPQFPPETAPNNHAASIIIPNWNGRDLLQKFLPFLMTAVSGNPGNEVIVIDNASSDGSVEFLRATYPEIQVLPMERNLGFGRAANHGVEAAANDIVVLLNNDMRVEPDFLLPLLETFTDPLVFAASSQIFFPDRSKPRQETGLTEIWWEGGRLRVGHRIDSDLDVAYPCAYAGGGSSAFDRRKFLELGGFDSLFEPFYYEDTDLSFLAWKRGWKVLYHPRSIVHHEHRGTIGTNFSPRFIDGVVKKNALLYCWKNINDWRMLASHFNVCLSSTLQAVPPQQAADPCTPEDVRRVFAQLPALVKSRWKAMSRRKISDREALRRTLGGYFRDRFVAATSSPPPRLNVLFVAPYPIDPPVHGGAVFMKEALERLSSVADVHLLSFVDFAEQLAQQVGLLDICTSAWFMHRPYIPPIELWTLTPNAIREFKVREFAWMVQRAIYTKNIDVIQLEYTQLGQYAGDFARIPCMLFEHDVAFQALWRRIRTVGATRRLLLEYFRMRLYEPRLLRQVTRVQVCTRNSAEYLQRLVPSLKGRIDWNVRAGIDVAKYNFVLEGREPGTLLFVGSFRHPPNHHALTWFVQEVLPVIVKTRPETTLVVVGSDPPKTDAVWIDHPSVRVLGSVVDVRVPLERYSVFVCPVLSGSGIRVKLLEAFACGIPAVSTPIGAEGLSAQSGDICELADTASQFAASTLKLLDDPAYRQALASRARHLVEHDRDSKDAAVRLETLYRTEVSRMRGVAIRNK